jgi:hypothetical protein
MNRSLLRAILAGVATPNQVGGPVGAFQAGLSGALGQSAAEEERARKAADEELRRQLDERLFGLRERATAADELRAKAEMARAQAGPGSHAFGFEDWQTADEATRKSYRDFRNAGDNPPGAARTPQFSARDRALITAYKRQHPQATDEDAVLAIQSGQFGGRPAAVETESQLRDEYGAPLYIGANGKATTDPLDKVTNQPNKPMLTRTRKYFGNPWDNAQPSEDPLEGLIR